MSIYNEINSKLNELYQSITPKDLSWVEDLRKTVSLFISFDKLKDFIKALELVRDELKKDISKKEQLRTISGIIRDLERSEVDFFVEKLKRVGNSLASAHKSLKDAINKEALRILEQTRLGKRDVVVGMLLRNFIIREIKIPPELIEALKPKYDMNLFRAFIYAFLSGFITQEDKGGQENE